MTGLQNPLTLPLDLHIFFLDKLIKQRTPQACSLIHSIKKGMFSVLGQTELI